MAKKTAAKKPEVKKPRRRLKRTARRSLAAVLMITAVTVAAIPVPENWADNGERATARAVEDGHTVYTYNELKTAKKDDGTVIAELSPFSDLSNKDSVLGIYKDEYDPESSIYVGKDKVPVDFPEIKKSLKIFDAGVGDELTWEYKYYSASGQIVLCKYNERYPRGSVNLEVDPNIEYFTISPDAFNNYFEMEKSADTNPSVSVDGEVKIKSSDTLTITMDIDPYSTIVKYTYTNYSNPASYESSEDKKFLEKYAKKAFDLQTEAYEDYDTEKAEWEKDHPGETYSADPPDFIKDEDENGKKIYYTMSDLIGSDLQNKIDFFCEHCETLNDIGTGYTLKAVRDTRIVNADGTAQSAYVAYGGTVTAPGAQNVDNYLVTKIGEHVTAIGTHAFSGVGNVDNIVLPTLIKYIGDEAFQNCNSVTNLNIADVPLIGNRAFQNCNALTTVAMGSGVKQIGVESFADCRNLTNITFSNNTATIAAGAFANCGKLPTLNLNNIIEPCEIGTAAFYDCASLGEVRMDQSSVTKIGDSAFACISGDSMTDFVFPSAISDEVDSLGDRLFCNRAALKTVVFPKNYGRGKVVTIPNSIFHGCSNLSYVEFPTQKGSDATACANLKYKTAKDDGIKASEELFADVVNKDFYVSGPMAKTNGDPAEPRESTWTAVTKAYGEPGFVPYLYYDNGVEYYEICSGDYLECIRKNEDGTGTLVSCKLRPGGTTTGTLIIPDQVGGTEVVAIDTNCFSDETLTKSVKKLVINDHIKSIAPSTFENVDGKWDKLKEVTIGSAVETIGERAFYGCNRLENITFKTPADYSKHQFPDSALKTNSDKLTIHGDIKEGYRPFGYAVNPNTYVKDAKDGIRVCYQSRWDSPESKHMTVMYGKSDHAAENGKEGYVTLLDYPKYSELSDITSEAGAELKQHCLEREAGFYEKYSNQSYDDRRTAFTKAWEKAASESAGYAAVDEVTGDPLYGPWINADYCARWKEWKDGNPDQKKPEEDSGKASMLDWLFEPLTVQAAADDPQPYFDKNAFNFMENYKECNGDETNIPTLSSGEFMDYKGWNEFEKQMISSVEDIVIPAGIESIDTVGFYDKEKSSYLRYLSDRVEYVTNGKDEEGKKGSTVPGLFSGWIEDYTLDESSDKGEYETETQGNDRIKSVVMTSVKYLPDYAFDNCERLANVTLGEGMQNVGARPFRDCIRLVNLTGNSNCPAENGILYEKLEGEKEAYKIVECLLARGKSNPIMDKTITQLSDPKLALVSSIDKNAFMDCNNLSVADLSGALTLKTIPDGCFKDCMNLVSVILPASINDIQDDSFAGVSYKSQQDPRCTVEIPGSEVSISDDAFGKDADYQFDLNHAKERICIKTHKDTAAYRYADYYKKEGMSVEAYPASENTYSVVFMDYDGTQIGNTQYITNDFVEEPDTTELKKEDHKPGYKFSGWLGTNGQQLNKKITQSCIFLAQYESDGTSVNGQYTVEFYNSITGQSIRGMGCKVVGNIYTFYVDAGKSFNEMENMSAPEKPFVENAEFKEWKDANGNTWQTTEELNETKINSNMRIMALFTAGNTSGGSTNISGGSTNTSGGATNTSGGSTSSSSKSSSSKNSSSSSTSTTSTTSGSDAAKALHRVTVVNGSGSGTYAVGDTVVISANDPAAGMKFTQWTTESSGVTLNQMTAMATLFTMPDNDVLVIANYEAGAATAAIPGTPAVTPVSTTGGTTDNDNGNTRVDIEKPGISNKDLAAANVNGSTDNFIVKISETDEATKAVAAALTNKYGTLDNILYYAMDISLYDSTGTTKISDTTGLSVDITIPIPDSLVAYGGNNMAGAVINGNQLESLNENFTTINGVPCVRFRATHFSPYTIYVDTGNLVEGMLDTTPQTGDPIHPKWFLSLGLACLSIILFLKRDKKTAVKVKAKS